jgi:hypothetical protein
MESEKLQRLHDTLSKLAPRGKVGGLGFNSFAKQVGIPLPMPFLIVSFLLLVESSR